MVTDSSRKSPPEGDWTGSRSSKAVRTVSMDDVVHAYRWILGREPENCEKIDLHLIRSGGNPEVLRRAFLSSPEFARQAAALGLMQDIDIAEVEGLAEGVERIVFLHVPKTGGTTLHFHLSEQLRPSEFCTYRHNSLLSAPAIRLSPFRVFSGHFDRRCVNVIPGLTKKVLTVLRKPRSRLISVYRYLAAHKPDRALVEGMELAKAARALPFSRFLEAALEINPAAVDNTYLRAFGSCLPVRRWEQAAEAPWMSRWKDPSDAERERMLQYALAFIERLDAVAILENLSGTAGSLFSACGLATPPSLERLKAIDQVDHATEGFEPPPTVTDSDCAIMDRLTQWDEIIYQAALQRSNSPITGL